MTGALDRSFEFGAPENDSGVLSESNAKSTMIDRVGADWGLGFETAIVEIDADSGLQAIRSLGGNHFYEYTSPLSNHRSSAWKLRHELVRTYVSPHFGAEG